MNYHLRMVTTGDKGGEGKTAVAILMAEWMLAQSQVSVIVQYGTTHYVTV